SHPSPPPGPARCRPRTRLDHQRRRRTLSPRTPHSPSPEVRLIRVLHVCAEAHPIVKTGGLADVTGSLPAALTAHGADARIVLPAYPAAIDLVGEVETVARLQLPGSGRPVRILRGEFPGTGLPLYLVDST